MGEQILVVSSDQLRAHHNFQGFLPLQTEQIHDLYRQLDVRAMDRDEVEENPSFKQLVAYTVVRADGRFLTYLRGREQGEERLRGNRSLGFGGHINSADDQANLFLDDYLQAAAFRELDEEIVVKSCDSLSAVGLLNDDSNPVGSVHLGLVYLAQLPSAEAQKRERSIARLRFATPDHLVAERDQFETWSQILIDNLHELCP